MDSLFEIQPIDLPHSQNEESNAEAFPCNPCNAMLFDGVESED